MRQSFDPDVLSMELYRLENENEELRAELRLWQQKYGRLAEHCERVAGTSSVGVEELRRGRKARSVDL